jgi:5-oxoprolinase (ATP-hydrolysing)
MKFVSRGDTTVVDAYLSPILRRYIDQVSAALQSANTKCQLMFMRSNGGLTNATLFQGKDAILSGPAGGVVGMSKVSQMAGFDKVIGFDMGGTSTDVSHFNGQLERSFETEVAGVRMRVPMMAIHTVAAGGGSILTYDGSRMRVGPESAGANPGPASYGSGGPLTITDANLMLGKISPEHFPSVFGPGGNEPLDPDIVRDKFKELAAQIDPNKTPEQIAEGFIEIAAQNMAQAIKKISIAKGYDVSAYVLTSFGGAGGQHACLVADALNMKTILLHPLAGVLSAYGMGLAAVRAARQVAVESPLTRETLAELETHLQSLRQETSSELTGQGIAPNHIHHRTRVHIRYAGTDTALPVGFDQLETVKASFEAAHRQQFGFTSPGAALIVEALELESIASEEEAREPTQDLIDSNPEPIGTTQFTTGGRSCEAPIFLRASLLPGQSLMGPAMICEEISTIIVEPGWRAQVTERGHILLQRARPIERADAIGTEVDPVRLEIFNNLFMSIAEQMGFTLEKTASSVNIKERLDFSCAIFDRHGNLIANAPHMPVHLGSMGVSVRTIIDRNQGAIDPGDVFVLNAPYSGGTHLPDITVITPVFDKPGNEILFYTAARGHHADIGGIAPGSMPAHSTTVEEEGVLINNVKLVARGTFAEAAIRSLLISGPYPSRNPEQNIADLKAQVAACEKGLAELRALVDQYSLGVVQAYMGHVQDNAEECVRQVIDVLDDKSLVHALDDGTHINLAITVDRGNRSATIDFTGTSAQQPTNFNAPSSICRAAVLYVFRCLVDDDIPLNAGCLKPLTIIVPEGSLLNPDYPAAVVAGNVETSQAITDALFAALGALAGSQGTMNNLTFGNETYQYYETICGGAGAGPGFDGASAVQTHMTNSRLTDPEVLEWRYPVRLESFEIRHGSGGGGKYRGGDGTVRKIKFLEEMELSILSSNRITAPRGLSGGSDAALGENTVERADGSIEKLQGSDKVGMQVGDSIILKTPGGGGFGRA